VPANRPSLLPARSIGGDRRTHLPHTEPGCSRRQPAPAALWRSEPCGVPKFVSAVRNSPICRQNRVYAPHRFQLSLQDQGQLLGQAHPHLLR
jgi:hypothetical protein